LFCVCSFVEFDSFCSVGEEEQFDENEAGLLSGKSSARVFASGFNDPEDDEADRIYAQIDDKMAERRRSRREKADLLADAPEANEDSTTAKLLFVDLKRDLSRVSEAEWAALPEVGDFRIKRLKRSGAIENAKERFLPVPDSVHSTSLLMTQTTGIVQELPEEGEAGEGEADFVKIGEARGKLLGMHLDRASKAIESKVPAAVISQGDEESAPPPSSIIAIASDDKLADIGDLKRARQLFASIIKSNRKNPSGWISAARLEFQAGNQKQARALIMKGCEECPKSEEMWKEAIKLHEGVNGEARQLLARALKSVPESVALWLQAANKESEVSARRKIIRAALERNPSSPTLWMALVELEDSEADARLLLARAVECAPDSTDLWLALARLQDNTDSARQVLNRARLACPRSFSVWINAARLEEANDSSPSEIKKILARGAAELSTQGVHLSFQDWQREAEGCEEGGDLVCASELMALAVDLHLSLVDESIKKTSTSTIIEYAKQTQYRTCSKSALVALLDRERECREAVSLLLDLVEKDHHLEGYETAADELRRLFERSLDALGADSPDLWIRYARNYPHESHLILHRAASMLSRESDQISVLKESIALEMPNFRKCPDSAVILQFHRDLPVYTNRPELMLEMMRAYKALGMRVQASEAAQEGILKFPSEAEFWLALAEGEENELQILATRGLEKCPTSIKLALRIVELERKDANYLLLLLEKTRIALQKSKLRADQIEGYDQLLATFCLLHLPVNSAISVFPPNFVPYCAVPTVRVSTSSTGAQTAKIFLNQFLKELPKSAVLWHLAVALEPRHLRRSKVTEALRRFENNNNNNAEEEALLHWTLAMLLEDPMRETELKTALSLDPMNFDLRAFTSSRPPTCSLVQTSGTNWRRFILENHLHFEPIEKSFDFFISKHNSNNKDNDNKL
jgi:pre-mRNA-processing factor 6